MGIFVGFMKMKKNICFVLLFLLILNNVVAQEERLEASVSQGDSTGDTVEYDIYWSS